MKDTQGNSLVDGMHFNQRAKDRRPSAHNLDLVAVIRSACLLITQSDSLRRFQDICLNTWLQMNV